MAEEKDSLQIQNKSRKRKGGPPVLPPVGILLIAALAVVLVVFLAVRSKDSPVSGAGEPQALAREGENPEGQGAEPETEPTLSAEEVAAAQEAEARQQVVDSYQNLGIVQVSGYLNVREQPGPGGRIIGKLQEHSACEILGTEGEWHHITSGGIEGYVHNQYVLTGEEARTEALAHVAKMAIVQTDKLNIRQQPEIDPSNVIGQALTGERYPVKEELGDWVMIQWDGGNSGPVDAYLSTQNQYAEVRYALNEARKLDLKAMALSQYDNLVISKVDNYLNVRKEPSTADQANIIGKFPGRAAGEILETLDGWYKIKSGNITGYITADPQYVAVGQEARDLAMESATLMAIVKTDMLNVRTEPSTESSIWTQISKEERYPVAQQLDGWVQIELDTGDSDDGQSPDKAFISTRDNNVEVRYALTEAIKFSPLEERANQQASLRNKVVNYALQFVGGRYVWGGNDPHTGADCSGFVRYVLKNVAGVNLPRTSREQAKTGRAITSSEMKPGDLIFYANSRGTINHVAMYIGNGQIVHAASRRSGIKISTWNYRSPKAIRSFLD